MTTIGGFLLFLVAFVVGDALVAFIMAAIMALLFVILGLPPEGTMFELSSTFSAGFAGFAGVIIAKFTLDRLLKNHSRWIGVAFAAFQVFATVVVSFFIEDFKPIRYCVKLLVVIVTTGVVFRLAPLEAIGGR